MIRRVHEDKGTRSLALFSDCLQYRYLLWRRWQGSMPGDLLFIMLNPSTADERKNDPTVERCEQRARAGGLYSGFTVCNLFAYRSTDPAALAEIEDPVGPDNDEHIGFALAHAKTVICAWGSHRSARRRAVEVLKHIRWRGHNPLALGVNKDGAPKHPLYLPYTAQPVGFGHG